jgi:hypothetical protein
MVEVLETWSLGRRLATGAVAQDDGRANIGSILLSCRHHTVKERGAPRTEKPFCHLSFVVYFYFFALALV